MRFQFAHTHAYPGCRVHLPAMDDAAAGEAEIEFSDGQVVAGRWRRDGNTLVLDIPSWTTARGTTVQPRRWRLHAPDGQWKVAARLPDDT